MDNHTSFPPSPKQERVEFFSIESEDTAKSPSSLRSPVSLEGMFVDANAPWGAVVCHPHPLHGGSMQNKVVDAAFRTVAAMGGNVLRFNFRGVGKSQGEYAEGLGEVGDLRGAIAFLQEHTSSDAPLWLIGYSFGTRVISLYMERKGHADGLILIAPPVSSLGLALFVPPVQGAHMILGERDEFCSTSDLHDFQAKLDHPHVHVQILPDTDHFFHGRLPSVVSWMQGILPAL